MDRCFSKFIILGNSINGASWRLNLHSKKNAKASKVILLLYREKNYRPYIWGHFYNKKRLYFLVQKNGANLKASIFFCCWKFRLKITILNYREISNTKKNNDKIILDSNVESNL